MISNFNSLFNFIHLNKIQFNIQLISSVLYFAVLIQKYKRTSAIVLCVCVCMCTFNFNQWNVYQNNNFAKTYLFTHRCVMDLMIYSCVILCMLYLAYSAVCLNIQMVTRYKPNKQTKRTLQKKRTK